MLMMNRTPHFGRRTSGATAGVVALAGIMLGLTIGCAGVLNPQFSNFVSGTTFPVAPGDTDFVVASLSNNTNFDITYRLAAETADGLTTIDVTIPAGVPPSGSVFECPVFRIGLGELGNLNSSAVVITDPATGQFFDVPWGQNPLSLDVSFRCGDTILFFANQDTNIPGGVRISVGRIDGTTQQGPFTGAETFEVLQEVVFTP